MRLGARARKRAPRRGSVVDRGVVCCPGRARVCNPLQVGFSSLSTAEQQVILLLLAQVEIGCSDPHRVDVNQALSVHTKHRWRLLSCQQARENPVLVSKRPPNLSGGRKLNSHLVSQVILASQPHPQSTPVEDGVLWVGHPGTAVPHLVFLGDLLGFLAVGGCVEQLQGVVPQDPPIRKDLSFVLNWHEETGDAHGHPDRLHDRSVSQGEGVPICIFQVVAEREDAGARHVRSHHVKVLCSPLHPVFVIMPLFLNQLVEFPESNVGNFSGFEHQPIQPSLEGFSLAPTPLVEHTPGVPDEPPVRVSESPELSLSHLRDDVHGRISHRHKAGNDGACGGTGNSLNLREPIFFSFDLLSTLIHTRQAQQGTDIAGSLCTSAFHDEVFRFQKTGRLF